MTGKTGEARGGGSRKAARLVAGATALGAGIFITVSASRAHTSEKGLVLTLPTDLYVTGGVIVVIVSFLLVSVLPAANVKRLGRVGWAIGKPPGLIGETAALLTLLAIAALVFAGFSGTQDPLANPLPLAVWTLWWIGFTVLHALFGNIWGGINPWRGACVLLRGVPWMRPRLARPPLCYPQWLGYWPAVICFCAFAWFELIYTVPQNPEQLAMVVLSYLLVHLGGVLLFGRARWLRYAECFSVFFRLVAWLSPLNGRPDGGLDDNGGLSTGRMVLMFPGLGLLHVRALPFSGIAFILLVLATVSFDGLSKTFWWLARIDVNPLDFPGRSVVAVDNTVGLFGLFAGLLGCYLGAVWLGERLAGQSGQLADAAGRYAMSIVPIALGYHLAHYLTAFLVDVQYAAITFNDPFGKGWNLVGLAEAQVTTSFLFDLHSVRLIWHSQVACIVIAHIAAVAVAHLVALDHFEMRRPAIVSQLPLTVLMVAYTLFGLWLLSTASIG